MQLTQDNYHSPQANAEYMSHHQFKSWMECPAKEWATQHGLYTMPMSDALMIGKRVDIALLTPEKLAEFDASPDAREWLFLKSGKPNAAHAITERCIARVKREPDAFTCLEGQRQAFITWELDGHPWRSALDVLDLEYETIVDLKTCKDFGMEWVTVDGKNTKVPWYEARGYWAQLAVYREAVKQAHGIECTCMILGVTKQDPADIDIITFEMSGRMDAEIEKIKWAQGEAIKWKSALHVADVPLCGACDWCISTKRIDLDKLTVAESLQWPSLTSKFIKQ